MSDHENNAKYDGGSKTKKSITLNVSETVVIYCPKLKLIVTYHN